MNSIFKQYIRENWLLSIGITEDDLSEDEKMDLEFIISGMISLLGKDFSPNNILKVSRIFDRDLGESNILYILETKSKGQKLIIKTLPDKSKKKISTEAE